MTICPKIWAKVPLKNEKSQFPVDMSRSKMSLLEFSIHSRSANPPYWRARNKLGQDNKRNNREREIEDENERVYEIKLKGSVI